jgi:hypothetical protein
VVCGGVTDLDGDGESGKSQKTRVGLHLEEGFDGCLDYVCVVRIESEFVEDDGLSGRQYTQLPMLLRYRETRLKGLIRTNLYLKKFCTCPDGV